MDSLFNFALLLLGFGFVIFWHELGHFLAAKWAGVRVDQFAVGFGQALLSWRKGLGFRVGTSVNELQDRARAHLEHLKSVEPSSAVLALGTDVERLDAAAREIGISETEYRLNWLPLGGYVKMLGQDDMDPTATSADSRSYTRKSVGQRMVIISAGVVMNIILAAILFCVLFMYGFNTPAAVIGTVLPNSPAQRAGLEPGDRILELNGVTIHDFNKLVFNTPLLPADVDVPIVIDRGGERMTKRIRPVPSIEMRGMLSMGVGPASLPRGPMSKDVTPDIRTALESKQGTNQVDLEAWVDAWAIEIAGKAVSLETPQERAATVRVLDQAMQSSGGKPFPMTLKKVDGTNVVVTVEPEFMPPMGGGELNFAGLTPRVRIDAIMTDSPAKGVLKIGDIVLSVRDSHGNVLENPSSLAFRQIVRQAGSQSLGLTLTVLRDGHAITLPELTEYTRIDRGQWGLSIGLGYDKSAVASKSSDSTLSRSPAALAQIPPGMHITHVNDLPTATWDELRIALMATQVANGKWSARLAGTLEGKSIAFEIDLSKHDMEQLASHRYSSNLSLQAPMIEPRQTSNPLTALAWGAGETRDLIIKTYVTLKRAFYDRTVPLENFSGPVGIIHAGSIFADRGPDWLVWFLALISANLAVVNFLPIPIVDGGHFCFLLLEKITGRPPSPRLMAAAQLTGIAVIMCFFLFVTYHDIARLVF